MKLTFSGHVVLEISDKNVLFTKSKTISSEGDEIQYKQTNSSMMCSSDIM